MSVFILSCLLVITKSNNILHGKTMIAKKYLFLGVGVLLVVLVALLCQDCVIFSTCMAQNICIAVEKLAVSTDISAHLFLTEQKSETTFQ